MPTFGKAHRLPKSEASSSEARNAVRYCLRCVFYVTYQIGRRGSADR